MRAFTFPARVDVRELVRLVDAKTTPLLMRTLLRSWDEHPTGHAVYMTLVALGVADASDAQKCHAPRPR